jgi:hypothetical protein
MLPILDRENTGCNVSVQAVQDADVYRNIRESSIKHYMFRRDMDILAWSPECVF